MHKRRRGETVSKAHSAACAERRSEGFVNLDINHTFQWEIIVDRKHCETALHHCFPRCKKVAQTSYSKPCDHRNMPYSTLSGA